MYQTFLITLLLLTKQLKNYKFIFFMKNQWLLLALIIPFIQTATAQSPGQKNALSFSGSIFDYYSLFNEKPLQAEGNTSYGLKIGYHRNLFGPVNLELPLRMSTVRIPTPSDPVRRLSDNLFLGSLDALLQIQAFKPTARLVPFLSGGVGGVYTEDIDFDIQFPVGAGLEIKLANNFLYSCALRLSFFEQRYSFN